MNNVCDLQTYTNRARPKKAKAEDRDLDRLQSIRRIAEQIEHHSANYYMKIALKLALLALEGKDR